MNQSICNICGANYENRNGHWKCPACGAYKPEEITNEEITLLFVADQKRRLSDFEEAERAYSDIIEKYPQNPYGYWGRLLCKHGIKYERDYDGTMIPTCCAPSIESLFSDRDCLSAIDLADSDTKQYFTRQAEYIERIRAVWEEKAKKEKPYDIFICYKDSDLANGIERTADSIEAQDIYLHLISQGYRVFFSRESLRDKTGEKYEPYIFNALSTAKVMLVYGKSSDHIMSTWLKNEWTRYLKMMSQGLKKTNSLIVACDGFSPSELPTVLNSKQCLDASRKTFFTDLDNEVREVIGKVKNENAKAASYDTQPSSSFDIEREKEELNRFISKIDAIEQSRIGAKKPSYFSKMFSGVSDEIDENKARTIKSFRLPETKEVLADFVIYASANIDYDTYNLLNQKANTLNNSKKAVARAWVERIDDAFEKAKLKFDDSNELRTIETIFKRIHKKISKQRAKLPALMIGIWLPIILIPLLVIALTGEFSNNDSDNSGDSQENTVLTSIVDASDIIPNVEYSDNDGDSLKHTSENEKQIEYESNITITKGSEYTYMCDEWNLYVIKAISSTIVKVEKWGKTFSTSKTVSHEYDVGTFDITDSSNGFVWMDDDQTAFYFNLKDSKASDFRKGKTVFFSISISDSDQYKGTNYVEGEISYSYINDDWHMYRAIHLSNDLIKIECWYRSMAIGNFGYGYDVIIVNSSSADATLQWTDEECTSFTILFSDTENSDLKNAKMVLFEKE